MAEGEGPSTSAAAVVGITPQVAAQLVEGIEGLTGKVTDLHRSVEADRHERATENEIINTRIRWSRRMVVAALLVATLAVGIAVHFANEAKDAKQSAATAQAAADKAQAAVDQANADRAERSRGSCIQFNVDQLSKRGFAHDQLFALSRLSGESPVDEANLPPDVKQRLDAYDSFTAAKFPYRDCSDAGIEEFFRHPPSDPNAQPGG